RPVGRTTRYPTGAGSLIRRNAPELAAAVAGKVINAIGTLADSAHQLSQVWHCQQSKAGAGTPVGSVVEASAEAVDLLFAELITNLRQTAGAAQPPSKARSGPASPGRPVCAPGAMAS